MEAAQLDRIEKISQNARTTWFGLIGVLAFVGVTLLGHKDADFFATGAGTQLPLINISVPVTAFFVTASILVAALYAYLHLYLMSLWDALADRVFPWLISFAVLWFRSRNRPDRPTGPRALGRVVVWVSVLLGWLFGFAILFFLWFRSMPAHDGWHPEMSNRGRVTRDQFRERLSAILRSEIEEPIATGASTGSLARQSPSVGWVSTHQ